MANIIENYIIFIVVACTLLNIQFSLALLIREQGPRHVPGFTVHGQHIKEKQELPKLGVRGRWITDSNGRVRIFHGFNAVRMSLPWYPDQMLNATKLQLYQEWGFNVVRLGVMWSGLEPREGRYNRTYLSVMQKIVSTLCDYGMYVILELHQDIMSSEFGSYDGLPLWLVHKFPRPRHAYPWPFNAASKLGDGEKYMTEAAGEAFQHLYLNTSGALDNLVSYWTIVVQAFQTHSNVLGYEIINEPWAGDIYGEPSLLLPGMAGSTHLMPLYDLITAAIRRTDTKTLVFYEPVTWGTFFNNKYVGSGFTRVPGGEAYRNRSVFSYHYYCTLITPQDLHTPYPVYKRVICDDLFGPRVFSNVLRDVEETGGSLFLTEFGMCNPDGNQESTTTIECDRVMSLADNHFQSWTYWDYGAFFDDSGNIRLSTVASFARAYPLSIAGIPHKMHYDITTAEFTLVFDQDPNITAPTEIFVPRFRYPGTPRTKQISPGFITSWDPIRNVLLVKPKSKLSVTKSCLIILAH